MMAAAYQPASHFEKIRLLIINFWSCGPAHPEYFGFFHLMVTVGPDFQMALKKAYLFVITIKGVYP